MKKVYVTLGILFLGMIAMAYLYFSNLNTETSANDLSLNAVATNAGIVFSFESDKSFYEILSGQEILQNVLGATKSKQLQSLKENLVDLPAVFNAIDGQKIYIGILPGLKDQVDFLMSTQLQPDYDPQKVLTSLTNIQAKINKTGQIYQITFADSSSIFMGLKDKLVVISSASTLVEQAIATEKKLNQNFALYIKANSRFNKNTLANLYVDFNQVPLLLKNILSNRITGELNIFNHQDSYAAFSYNFSKEKLLFNGSTVINDPDNYYGLFTNIPEQEIIIDNILPQKTANYCIYAIADYKNWQKQLYQWMAKRKEEDQIKNNITNINQRYRLDLEQIFPRYFKNQLVTFQLNSGEKFGAIALSNGEKVNQLLLDLSSEYAPDIRIFKESNLPYAFFGEPFKKFERPFYTIIDNYLIMANNASSIQVFLNSYRSNALLVNDEDYAGFSNQLSSFATISFYINHKNSNDIFGRNLKLPFYKQYQSKAGFKNYSAFCYQLSGDKGKFLSNLLLYKTPEKTMETDTLKTNP